MKRKRRWFSILVLPLFAACAMFRPGNPAIMPGTGPGTPYPCGYQGHLCHDTNPPTCCTYGTCANDGEPYCDMRGPSDPSDPVTWGASAPARGARAAAH